MVLSIQMQRKAVLKIVPHRKRTRSKKSIRCTGGFVKLVLGRQGGTFIKLRRDVSCIG